MTERMSDKRLAEILAIRPQNRWRHTPYHGILAALQAERADLTASEQEYERLRDALGEIGVEVLAACADWCIDETACEGCPVAEIAAIFTVLNDDAAKQQAERGVS